MSPTTAGAEAGEHQAQIQMPEARMVPLMQGRLAALVVTTVLRQTLGRTLVALQEKLHVETLNSIDRDVLFHL